MNIERFTIQACCGKTSLIFKTDQPITQSLLTFLVNAGFVETAQFTKAGILYVDNPDLIITGPFGSDKLQVKCKVKDCEQKVNDFETLLLQAG